MNINYYRQPNIQGTQESWQACQFTSGTDLSAFTIKPLVTINGQPILRQHHVTYLTGKETCRAHHFAKHLAIQVLTGKSVSTSPVPCAGASATAPVSTPPDSKSPAGKVLWIDTVNGPHVSAAIYRELAAHATAEQDLHYICLDILAGQRYDFWYINRAIEALIKQIEPDLVVIDDIDHFMPHCGINIATEVAHVVRDTINHSETAFLFIGYNHLGKKAGTTGNLGKQLFVNANDIFSLSTQREVTTVRHICGYDLRYDPDKCDYRFTIGPDNLPHEAEPFKKDSTSPINDDTLCDIVTDILQPGEAITPDEFHHQVTTRHRQLKQQDRTAALINQALHLNLITLTPSPASETPSPATITLSPQCSPVNGDAIAVPRSTVTENKEDTASKNKTTASPLKQDKASTGPVKQDKATASPLKQDKSTASPVPRTAALPPSPRPRVPHQHPI